MKKELLLRPVMPKREIHLFFKDKLPSDLPVEHYKHGLSCLGYARLILTELGGPEKARIFWIEKFDPETDTTPGHAYVAPESFSPRKRAYNNYNYSPAFGIRTVGFVKKYGKDITDEVLKAPWTSL